MTISFCRHQIPTEIIRQAVWLYVRFTRRYRDVEDPLGERGLDVSYETMGLEVRASIRPRMRRRPSAADVAMAFDETAVTIAWRRFWLGRAVDDEREVFDLLALKAYGEAGGHVPEWASDRSRRATLVARASASLADAKPPTEASQKSANECNTFVRRGLVEDRGRVEEELCYAASERCFEGETST